MGVQPFINGSVFQNNRIRDFCHLSVKKYGKYDDVFYQSFAILTLPNSEPIYPRVKGNKNM